MAFMIRTMQVNLISKSAQIRNALDQHMAWIRLCTDDDGARLVQLRFDHSLAALAAQRLFGQRCRTTIRTDARSSLEMRLERIDFPPGVLPAAALRLVSLPQNSAEWLTEWLDCPVALHFSGFSGPVIAVNLPLVDGASHVSQWREVSIVKREDIPALLKLMEEHFHGRSAMKIMGENSVEIQRLSWDDLVLDESVVRLVKDDFHLFLDREAWYRRHRLPFRRGYLLHGPPGNGKSSVIRAMLSMPGISGFTLNPFRPFTDDDLLAAMFSDAAQSTPALIVLEDLDRWYPADKEGEPKSLISVQQLLNQLDGVGNQNGIIVVATANNPSLLDPAILRRPGRFDRVAGFQNPSAELRKQYLAKLCADVTGEDLTGCTRMTAGFSFAQLRETYISAGQLAMEGAEQISAAHLGEAARVLSETMMLADRKWNAHVGFREPL